MLFLIFKNYIFIYLCVGMYVWRSECSYQEWLSSAHLVGPGVWSMSDLVVSAFMCFNILIAIAFVF